MKYVIGLFAALLVAGGIAVFLFQKAPAPQKSGQPTQEDINEAVMADALLWQVVTPKQVAIVASALTPANTNDEQHPMTYAGKLKNASDRTIDKVAVRIRLYDCQGNAPGDWSKCAALDDDTQNIEVKIGPKETAAVSGHFQFHHTRPSNTEFTIRPEINRVHVATAAKAN